MKTPAALALALLFSLPALPAAEPKGVVIASYNVENYVGISPVTEGGRTPAKPKTEAAIAALIRVIKEVNPDILGVCEMGSPERFEDFKKRLAAAGLGYVDAEYLQAADPDRHLALVSRFPIVARNSQADVPFELNGQPEKVRRGFLDVTIQVAREAAAGRRRPRLPALAPWTAGRRGRTTEPPTPRHRGRWGAGSSR